MDIALIGPKLFLKQVRDMEAVSLLEGEVLENNTGHVLMENSQDSTPSNVELASGSQCLFTYLQPGRCCNVVVPTGEEFAGVVLDIFKNADPCSKTLF